MKTLQQHNIEITEALSFIVQEVDFWNVLLGNTSFAIVGIMIYIGAKFHKEILSIGIFKVVWSNINLIGWGTYMATLLAIVLYSFPAAKKVLDGFVLFGDLTAGEVGFIGVGALLMVVNKGKNKNAMLDASFKSTTGIDPHKEA